MPDKTKGEATITLESGRELTFAFDVNAFIDIADELQMDVPEVLKLIGDKDNPPGLKAQRVIFWGGLQKHHPEMTIRDAGEVMLEAAPAMAKAMGAAMPKADEGAGEEADADPPKPRGRGTGTKP